MKASTSSLRWLLACTARCPPPAARTAGYTHVHVDGTLVRTDRSTAAGPTVKVDLWWSGKHHHHGGNVRMVTAPDGWPLWVSDVRPGREHDVTCARSHPGLLAAVDDWTGPEHVVLADLGYEGENGRLTCPFKTHPGGGLTVDQRAFKRAALRDPGPGRTRELPAQDHLQGPPPRQPVSMANRRDHRRRARPTPHRARPDNVIHY